jgi:arginyl-tRNA synthetase
MPFEYKNKLKEQIQRVVDHKFGPSIATVEITVPPNRELGDLSTPVAMSIAKALQASPMKIAEELNTELGDLDLVLSTSVVKPGYINFYIDYPVLAEVLLEVMSKQQGAMHEPIVSGNPTVVIEHTSVNPNKAMHVGHLRNSVLGDTLGRMYDYAGYRTEIQNYIDDTGVQVADVVLAILASKEGWYDDAPVESDFQKKDYFYWDIYAWIVSKRDNQKLLADKQALQARIDTGDKLTDEEAQVLKKGSLQDDSGIDLIAKEREILHALEKAEGEYFDMARAISTDMVNAHLATNSRLNIFYNILVWESSILGSNLWKMAFELLKKSKKFVYKETGRHAGCWVLDYQDDRKDKVFVRSDGTSVYVAKDFAYHLWKYGLVPDPLKYYLWGTQVNGGNLYSTVGDRPADTSISFADTDKIINVIGNTQSYEQQAVIDSLAAVGYQDQAASYVHLAYGSVLLSKAAVTSLGVQVDEERRSYPMSGRKGIGVKVDDLIDRLTAQILDMNADKSDFVIDETQASQIAVAAIRYFIIKIRHDKELVFDFEQALQTNGNTGVYLLYSLVRARNILEKSGDHGGLKPTRFGGLEDPEIILLNQIIRFREVLVKTLEMNDPSLFSTYVFDLATAFSAFYASTQVLKAEPKIKSQRLALVKMFSTTMEKALELLGITPLKKM